MRSLYFKVLLWFLTTVIVTGVGLLWVSAIAGPDRQMPPFRRGVVRQAEAAFRVYEGRGAEGLGEHLRLLEEVAGVAAIVTNAAGRDLITGEDRSDLIARYKGLRVVPPMVGVRSLDGKYWFVVPGAGRPPGPPFVMPAHIWVFASVGLLSLWLARYVTDPVRKLRDAVEQFGAGNLARRVDMNRGDEVGQLGAAFNKMAGRIESLVGAQRRLLADISHELRSPLTRLGLAVELARSGGDTEAALDRIQREADRLNHLVGGLLQVTRGEADPAAIRFVEVDLDALVEEIVDDARLDAGNKGCEIRYKGVKAVLDGDAELLRRAVENVLRNAVRHAPDGSEVDVEVSAEGAQLVVAVRDYGPGVPESALPQLFEAFYRVEQTGGFGLGLSIAQRAVALHKGSISAENALPGLRVTLRLSRM